MSFLRLTFLFFGCFFIEIWEIISKKDMKGSNEMTVFDIMPCIWLLACVLFFIFLVIFSLRHAAAFLSAALLGMLLSLLSLPMRIQCGAFFVHTVVLCVVDIFIKPKKPSHYCIALTEISASGGTVKCDGKCIDAYCRDSSHTYKCGSSFKLDSGKRCI